MDLWALMTATVDGSTCSCGREISTPSASVGVVNAERVGDRGWVVVATTYFMSMN